YAKIHIIKKGIFNHSDHCIVIFIIEVRIFILKIASTSRGKKGISRRILAFLLKDVQIRLFYFS
ncbi:hypothetical protein ACXO91_09465, partial [Lactobacillus delbrueckii subsp. bulgaricus]